MSLPLLLFFVFALLSILGAVTLILAREPIHSALALIVVMISLAMLYVLLGAEFVSAVQIIVYAGAVMVLFVFVIMLLNAGEEERTDWSRLASKYFGLPLGGILLAWLAYWMWHAVMGSKAASAPGETYVTSSTTADLSKLLFSKYLLPFEATSILILIAILGALVLAKRDE
ncbi:MAG TPA: NADH-quinone oxidoreductase subunit J [Verrucomicrobiae bacterium]|nr:NADH-quinone oxidoreductase subunit J [Verrucomicrobiae bacterium]